jgi:hypothetical protein
MRRLALLPAVLAVLAACGQGRPEVPDSNDPAFVVDVPRWTLVGDGLTEAQTTLSVSITAPAGVERIEAWTTGVDAFELDRSGSEFTGEIPIDHLEIGAHPILLAADGASIGFAAHTFRRSHALYVLVGTDWDDPDNTEQAYMLQEDLHARFPELLITHFAAPYSFTDPTVTAERRELIAAWLTEQAEVHGDEIGLHIHPFCNFVESAGLTCRTEPSTVYDQGDTSGYTVMCAAYDQAEFTTLLEHADQLFAAAGLPKPTSFRAGGWTTDLHTLAALRDAGYVADTSALNWERMEEWQDQQNGVLYEWNSTQWSTIDDTSQPYYPSVDDIQSGAGEPIGILEVPDNGIMVDYVSGDEMIEIFGKNWDGQSLAEPRQVTYGYHPSNYIPFYHDRLVTALEHVDQYRASAGAGPVVYANLSDLARVWPQ